MASLQEQAATLLEPAPGRGARAARALPHYLALPALVALVLAALYFYVNSQELDTIEARSISFPIIQQRTLEHIGITAASTIAVIIIAVPLGILLTRPRARFITPVFLAVANTGQATPSIGVLALIAIVWRIGFGPAVVGLVAYAVLPFLRNTMVGLDGVDRSMIEAGRGMGMSKTKALTGIEIPLAVPVILAGIRTALVINVGTAALAWSIDGGGLGDIIQTGLSLNRDVVVITGAVLTSALALLIDWLGGIVEDVLRPKGL